MSITMKMIDNKVVRVLQRLAGRSKFGRRILARFLFKKAVKQVVVEVSSDCNRTCSYCPHSVVKRPKQRMEESLLGKIIKELSSLQYSQSVCFNWFNEPLLHSDHLVSIIEDFRRALPQVFMRFSTNGDLLTKEMLERLERAGLNELIVTMHPHKAEHWDEKTIQSKIEQRLAALHLPADKYKVNQSKSVFFDTTFKRMKVQYFSLNFLEVGTDRAGSVGTVRLREAGGRTRPCWRPFSDFSIAYDGTVYPCCQFYHGFNDHGPFSMGNVHQSSMVDIYASMAMESFRAMAMKHGLKKYPCSTCGE